MPRPPRCRRICGAPQVDTFCPNGCENTEPILLTLDEYEVIRLVDLEQKTHEQCAVQMDISRSTVQEIYDDCKVFIAPYTPSPDFDKNTTAEELLTTFGMGRNPVVSLWIYTKDDTVGKDTDMQQLTSKIQAMGYSVDVGVYYLSEENYEVVNEDDYLNYNIGAHQDFYEYFENVYIYPDSFELILSDWKEESSK